MTEPVSDSSASSSSSSSSSSPPPSRLRCWLNLLALGLGFTFIFTSFNALQNLASSLFLEHSVPGIGRYTLSILYAFAAIGCTLAPFVLQILGTKYCLVIGAISHALYASAHFCSSEFTLYPAGALLGLATGVVWPSQGKSVTKFAEDLSAVEDRPLPPVVSLFNGVFFGLFMSSQIFGNSISTAVLKTNATEIVDLNISRCGSNYCPISPSSANSSSSSSTGSCETPDSKTQTIFGIFLVSVSVGLVLWALLPNLSRVSKAERGPLDCGTVSQALFGGFLFTFQDQRALLLMPMFFYTGLEQGIFFGDYMLAFVTCTIGIDGVGIAGLVYGIVDAISSLAAGKVAKFTGQSGLLFIAVVVQAAMVVVMLLKTPIPDERWILYLIAGFWGVADAIWQTQTSAMVGVVFQDRQESAFACWRLWQQLGFVLTFATSPSVCTKVGLWIGLAVLAVSTVGLSVIEVKRKKTIKEEEERGGKGEGGDGGVGLNVKYEAASQRLAVEKNEN